MDRFLRIQADAYEAQLAQIAQGLLAQNRPSVENCFSGCDNRIDFESYLSKLCCPRDIDEVRNSKSELEAMREDEKM